MHRPKQKQSSSACASLHIVTNMILRATIHMNSDSKADMESVVEESESSGFLRNSFLRDSDDAIQFGLDLRSNTLLWDKTCQDVVVCLLQQIG